MAEGVDDDVSAAVVALWTVTDALAQLFARPVQTGPLKSMRETPQTLPYASIVCEFKESERGTGYRLDRRRVTLTAWGTREQAVSALESMLGTFNRNLGRGGEDDLTLAMPSGARFISWVPEKDGELKREKTQRAGHDVWSAEVVGVVTTVRD